MHRSTLERIARFEGEVHCFDAVTSEAALAEADEVDRKVARGQEPGVLAGVPVALKDNICTRGIPTTAGSHILEGWHPPYDATVVDTPSFPRGRCSSARRTSTSSRWGRRPRTPVSVRRAIPGTSGSSQVAPRAADAAAVASGLAAIALGSDTGGSIRQPAALCGVVGMKPTYGGVSRFGLIAFASSLDQIGPLANRRGRGDDARGDRGSRQIRLDLARSSLPRNSARRFRLRQKDCVSG